LRVFKRERRRLVPTPEARALYQEVRRAFVGLDYLTRFAGELRDLRQGHLVLAASHATCTFYLPAVVAEFLREHPGLSVSLHTMDSPGIAQAVGTGRADLGIAQFEVLVAGVHRERLRSIEAVCVLPRGDVLARHRIIRPTDLHGQPFIAMAAVNPLRKQLEAALEAGGVVPRIVVDTPLASTACRLVMEGVGLSILDRWSAEANLHQAIVIRPFQPAIVEDLVLLTPAQEMISAAATAFAELLRGRLGERGRVRRVG
jgi:DNA-binding transcriptional LysR family regulator